MAKRYNTRGISKARVYTFKQAARIVGVSEVTFRKWPSQGLRVIRDKRPFLVCGDSLLEFLDKLQSANKQPMQADQFFCLSCRGPRDAAYAKAIFEPQTVLTGRLSAHCSVCGRKCGRYCKTADLESLRETLSITFKAKANA